MNDAGAAEAVAAAASAAVAETSVPAELGGSRWEDRWDEPGAWEGVMKDLRRIKWADERVYELMLERLVCGRALVRLLFVPSHFLPPPLPLAVFVGQVHECP